MDDFIKNAVVYLGRSVQKNGRFVYLADAKTGESIGEGYNLTRHAGALCALLMFGRTPKTDAALAYLMQKGKMYQPGRVAVFSGGISKIGTCALALIACELSAHQGDKQAARAIPLLAQHILSQLKDDGLFHHGMDEGGKKTDLFVPYFDGESALALIKAGAYTKSSEFIGAAVHALRSLAQKPQGKDFADHWLCLAAEELQSLGIKDPSITQVAVSRAKAVADQINSSTPEEALKAMSNRYGRAAVRLEAIASAAHLDADDSLARAAATLRRIISDAVIQSGPCKGAIPEDTSRKEVRIDTVQHAISGFSQGAQS